LRSTTKFEYFFGGFLYDDCKYKQSKLNNGYLSNNGYRSERYRRLPILSAVRTQPINHTYKFQRIQLIQIFNGKSYRDLAHQDFIV